MSIKKNASEKKSGRKPSNVVDVCGPKSGVNEDFNAAEQHSASKLYDAIDQMFAAVLSQNESEATIKALRPQVEEAVKALIAERGLPKTFTGTIEYHGFQIVVSRPRSYTWEQNTNPAVTSDPNHAIYLQQLDLQRRINDQLKDMRADVKRTAEKLAAAHPESESIKRALRLAFLPA